MQLSRKIILLIRNLSSLKFELPIKFPKDSCDIQLPRNHNFFMHLIFSDTWLSRIYLPNQYNFLGKSNS